MDFFQTAGKNLAAAEAAAGIKHHVALSVVGTERLLDRGYFPSKLPQESLIKNAPTPYTIARATQFFEFLRGIALAPFAPHDLPIWARAREGIANSEEEKAREEERTTGGGRIAA